MATTLIKFSSLRPIKRIVLWYVGDPSKIKSLQKKAKEKDKSFYPQFNLTYRDFVPSLLELGPELIDSELKLCAYIKIDLSTKEIAHYTDATFRSVESKKYRIRKKLGLKRLENLNSFIMSL